LIELLKNKDNLVALIGASNNPKKYGNKILLNLLSKNYKVVPINPKEKQVNGLASFSKVSEMQKKPSIINFVVPPSLGLKITKDLVKLGYDNFWYQPGAESKEISEYLLNEGKKFIDDKCIMVEAK